ncbi:MAG: AsmA family protein, partial [Alphaproteobacteria bacterium]|nr:AsmA family protein [Alphaproteobacteria bacterium]
MRTLLKIIVGLVLLLVIAFGGIYFALSRIDLARYQDFANERIAAATGHVLHIDGPLRVVPSLRPAVIAERIRFSDAQGTAAGELARATRIEASIELLPLLRGEVRIARILL